MTIPNYDPNELVKDGNSITPTLRVIPRVIQPKTLAAGTGTLPPLTPLAYHTGIQAYVPFDSTGSSGETVIDAFLWPDQAVLVSGNPIIGNVLLAGEIHHDDIPIPAGETQDTVDTALLASSLRSKGFVIQGLAKWH